MMTMISRFFGYFRDVVIAVHFGASGLTDAFFVAFRIPNFLRRLFAEGAFSQAFVPVFTEYKEKRDPTALRELLASTTGTLFLVLSLITIIGVVGAPLLITMFAPGFIHDPHRHALASVMLRLTFPYLLFISLTAMAGGVLNSFGKFAVPAFTPVFLNFSLIAVTLWLAPHLSEPIIALAIGVLIAGVVQLAFQLPFLFRLGYLVWPRWRFDHPGVQKIMRLMMPALFGASIVQINLLFDTLVASFLAPGSISWLYYSDRFVEMPLALFGIALGTVILPQLSKSRANGDDETFRDTLDWALRIGALFTFPAAIGLTVLARPIMSALIEYHAFNSYDAQMSAMSLMAFASGLPAFVLIKILAPGFYARQDTRTPVRIGVIAMIANMLLTLAIVVPWYFSRIPGPHAGLALSTALAAYLNAGQLYRKLYLQNVFRSWRWVRVAIVSVMAALLMGGVLLWFSPKVGSWVHWSAAERILHLALLIVIGLGIYSILLLILGIRKRDFTHA